jgi:hypothetical protein
MVVKYEVEGNYKGWSSIKRVHLMSQNRLIDNGAASGGEVPVDPTG